MEKLNEKQVKDFLDDVVRAYNNYLRGRDDVIKNYNNSIVAIAVRYKADGMNIYVPEEKVHHNCDIIIISKEYIKAVCVPPNARRHFALYLLS